MKNGLNNTDRCKPVDRNDEQQEIEKAFGNLMEAFKGLKESTDELVGEFTQLNQTAKANGGKIPDVNEILRKVLDEQDGEE